jgi:hypothetical protein
MSSIILEKIKPITSEEYLDINDSFWAHYGYFKNNFSYTRPPDSWSKWSEKQFIKPTNNLLVAEAHDKGVKFGCYEHVSVCVSGNSDYIMVGTEGTITHDWNFGIHNVENGWGYIPKDEFTRIFYNDYVLCCIIQKPNRPANLTYNFRVITENENLPQNIEFLHVAYGNLEVNGSSYTQKQTVYNLNSGTSLSLSPNSIVIAGYTIT